MVQYITFEDILATIEKDQKTSIGMVRLRALDPLRIIEYVGAIQSGDTESMDAAKRAIGTMREAVTESFLMPAFTPETVAKVPTALLTEFWEVVVKASGAGGENEAEAEKFREEPAVADDGAVVQ